MNERQSQLLKLVITTYIKTAEPVGSQALVASGQLSVSAATVRNELRSLEEMGYLTHPHTSAGRIPTEKGYACYLLTLASETPIQQTHQDTLHTHKQHEDTIRGVKNMAKYIAEVAGNAVIVTFGPHSHYYTGISHLFSQPEFRNYAHAMSMTTIFDQCEEKMPEVLTHVDIGETRVLLGEQNPLGSNCATIVTRFNEESLFALVGPLRMDYKQNIPLIKYIASIIS